MHCVDTVVFLSLVVDFLVALARTLLHNVVHVSPSSASAELNRLGGIRVIGFSLRSPSWCLHATFDISYQDKNQKTIFLLTNILTSILMPRFAMGYPRPQYGRWDYLD
jgi:hypothetical protein